MDTLRTEAGEWDQTIESNDLGGDIGQLARLGFRLERIRPADDPTQAELVGHGIRIRLGRGPAASAGGMTSDDTSTIGVHSLVTRGSDGDFGAGRAGMTYRDLLPVGLRSRFIASHIRIDTGGDVDDYVHFHDIAFQLIFCVSGWVRVVYEDQGAPIVMGPGDCVLQPPGIRHRVLEASRGLEVVELASPGVHDTFVDHEMVLPTSEVHEARVFGGQRFVHHVGAEAPWVPWRHPGFECRDTRISEASSGAVGLTVVRRAAASAFGASVQDVELLFGFVLGGSATLNIGGNEHRISVADNFYIRAGDSYSMSACSTEFQFLEVRSPIAALALLR